MTARQETLTSGRARTGAAAPAFPFLLAALILFALTLAIRWPGVAMYDTISQYEQATSGAFEDWHPPIMARTWSLLIKVWPGTQPFLVLQSILWWGGFGLIAAALAGRGRPRTASAVLVVGAFPLFVGWETVILKDCQLACCLIAATGLVAYWRLAERPIPRAAKAAILVLFAYATLVRGNAVFATVPFAFFLFDWAGVRGWIRRIAMALATILAVLIAGPLINHHVLGASPSKVERTLPLYDIVGTAHQAHLSAIPGLPADLWRESEAKACYTPYFWNPYGMETQCETQGDAFAFNDPSGAPLIKLWVRMVLTHPIAWIEHRARHFNSNVRFLVGRNQADAAPPISTEKNDVGLGAPANGAARALITAAQWIAATPLGWPYFWLALAIALLWASWRAVGPTAWLGRALAFSAMTMSASYALVSIASDLRYHLWSMLACALATVLLTGVGAFDRRRLRFGLVVVASLAGCGIVARLVLPPEPFPYPVAGKLPDSTTR